MSQATAEHGTLNISARLSAQAAVMPDAIAIAAPAGRDSSEKRIYDRISFRELDQQSTSIATGLQQMGVKPGTRLVLLVPPGLEFFVLTFGLFKAGVAIVLIDPGMGRDNLLNCLQDTEPEGFVAIPKAHVVRSLLRRRFPKARFNVTVGRRWFWGGKTFAQLVKTPHSDFEPVETRADSPAAIIFTTGSTGPPKGVLYEHGNFDQQVAQIQSQYDIGAGEIDLPGFPLFGLFNAAMGVTTVIPDMDPTRPAQVNPRNIVEAVNDWNVTQSFGSPAIWNVVGRYCEKEQIKLPTLRRVLSAGAPVPPDVLARMKSAIADDGDIHTPYGATESLPVATISATEVLGDTAARSKMGAGTCVGHRYSGIEWKVISISDDPIAKLEDVEPLPHGQIGELIVTGPVVTRKYVTRTETNAIAKIQDGKRYWHRMGDVGYLDDQDRFWFCGRKAHRVTADPTMYCVPCEAVFNCHDEVYRSALVGIGTTGNQTPVLIAEPFDSGQLENKRLISELAALAQENELTRRIDERHILLHPSFPVDIRHNAKIFREKLAVWAADELNKRQT